MNNLNCAIVTGEVIALIKPNVPGHNPYVERSPNIVCFRYLKVNCWVRTTVSRSIDSVCEIGGFIQICSIQKLQFERVGQITVTILNYEGIYCDLIVSTNIGIVLRGIESELRL